MARLFRRSSRASMAVSVFLLVGFLWNHQRRWHGSVVSSFQEEQLLEPATTTTTSSIYPTIDIVSIGSHHRPDYQQAQQSTFGSHPSVRHFVPVTEQDDVETDCNERLTWRDVQNISGFCGGLRRDIQTQHRLLFEWRVKFAKPQWLQRKANPVAWLCAQKRPMAGFYKLLERYQQQQQRTIHPVALPDFVILMDDDTYYNLNQVVPQLVQMQREQVSKNDGDDRMVLTGCLIRSKLERFKWFFPFGGWGTIFSKGALQSLLEPLHCHTTTTTTTTTTTSNRTWSAQICPQLQKDRIGEYQVYREGMSLADIMYAYTFREPYTDQKHWKLGFCLHSDWVWGYFSNYYNISVALGRRSHELKVDRIGAYNGSEMNWNDPDNQRDTRRQCEFKSDDNCTTDAHMCHYITPAHMRYLSSQHRGG